MYKAGTIEIQAVVFRHRAIEVYKAEIIEIQAVVFRRKGIEVLRKGLPR